MVFFSFCFQLGRFFVLKMQEEIRENRSDPIHSTAVCCTSACFHIFCHALRIGQQLISKGCPKCDKLKYFFELCMFFSLCIENHVLLAAFGVLLTMNDTASVTRVFCTLCKCIQNCTCNTKCESKHKVLDHLCIPCTSRWPFALVRHVNGALF